MTAVFGFVRPSVDAHTLGIDQISQLLVDCGYEAYSADFKVCSSVSEIISRPTSINVLCDWLSKYNISHLGFSYRLDPDDAQEYFGKFFHQLKESGLLRDRIKKLFFAGLPEACNLIRKEYNGLVTTFAGDEQPMDSLKMLGVPEHKIPRSIIEGNEYDNFRLKFGAEFITKEKYADVKPVDRRGSVDFGSSKDNLISRIRHKCKYNLLPLTRAHAGPYSPNRSEAINEFKAWAKKLAESGYLDVLSIGTSQLTQSRFGEDWGGQANGGGVPINSEKEYRDIWEAARPMLVRTYAGTKNIPFLAQTHEKSINIAWHALSFWWFCQIDGRGPNNVYENLQQHFETLKFVSQTEKPFEPNIPHHFAFRGADDISCVLSGYLAAKSAKLKGVKILVLPVMLNTPKHTWGVQDLAKARATINLVRELESPSFRVLLQPRAGLDYFSSDIEKAKMQLASVSALMDDIEPHDHVSPDIIHVVSYSEASFLATPEVINESIKITQGSIRNYRLLRKLGKVPDMIRDKDVMHRTNSLVRDAKTLLKAIERMVPNVYSAEGFYKIFFMGFFPTPNLWEGREEFSRAVNWNTGLIDGGMVVLDKRGLSMSIDERIEIIKEIEIQK